MKKFWTLVCCMLPFTFSAQEHVTEPMKLSLDEGWRFHEGDIPFPEIKGHGASYANAKAGRSWGAAAPGYDDSDWRVLDLPHDWAVEQPFNPDANLSQGYRDRGYGWYRRTFQVSPEDKGKHFELHFDGIATYSTVWVNGTLLHRNWCGYTSSYIDVTPYLNFGDAPNTIAVRVDAHSQEGWWYEGAGIYRHTWLVKRSPLHLKTDGVYANPVKQTGDEWLIPIEAEVNNAGKLPAVAEVKSTLYGPDGKAIQAGVARVEVEPLRDATARMQLTVHNPQLWDIDSPILYTVKTEVVQNGVKTDELTTRCGFRSYYFDADSGFFLNGRHLKIKGVCNHQDHAGVGVAMPDALWGFRMELLKDMGVNAYRCSHNPPSVELLDLCDSLGILVMDENRVFNTSPEHVRQLEWLVKRDRNRPSVILWSVFNEEPMQGTENGYEMVRRMRDVVEQLDTTRPVTAAMNGGLFEPYNVSQAVEIVGFNYQHYAYDEFHQKNPTLKLTSSEDCSAFQVRGEYQTDMEHNIIDSYDTRAADWGQTHRDNWKAINERPFLAGSFVWTGFDYRGEPTPFRWPSASSFFGIMDLCGFPKMAYYLRQAQWIEDRPVMHLVPHWNWPTDSIGKPIKVMTLTNADSVRVLLNGKQVGAEKVDKYEMNTFYIPYKPGKLEAIGYKGGKECVRYQVETTGEAKRVHLIPYRESLAGDGRDAMPITVEVVDKKGRHIPTANLPMTFSISGPGRIIGVGNGNPNSHEPDKAMKRNLFNGYAQVIVQTNKGATEPILLTASTPGLESATIQIHTIASEGGPAVEVVNPSIVLDRWMLSPFSAERLNPTIELVENDMNSWQQINAGTLSDMPDDGYYLCRASFAPFAIHKQKGGVLRLREVYGEAEVWVNGKQLATKQEAACADLEVPFPPTSEEINVRILFKGSPSSPIGLGKAALIER